MLNVHYQWGGNNPLTGLDCSGFVQWILASVGQDPPGRQTANDLYQIFKKTGFTLQKPQAGALIFYGEPYINHVAFAIDDFRVIEAASGDQSTVTIEIARKQNALVKMKPYDHRKDLVAIVLPPYKRVDADE